jgi:hypothetical protein
MRDLATDLRAGDVRKAVEKSLNRRKDLERGLQQGTSGRFTTRTEDLCTVQQKAIVQCPLVCSWGW